MFNYYVRLFSRSALVIGDEAQKFEFNDSQIIVYDRWNKNNVHEGLLFSVRLTEDNLFSAMKKSLPVVLPLSTILSTAHSTAIDDPKVIFAMDFRQDEPDREFGQVIYNVASGWLHRRIFDRDTFGRIWTAFWQTSDLDLQSALFGAINELRKSYNVPTLLDEFVGLYSGLEQLNPALQKKYGLPTTEDKVCECGRAIKSPLSSGIKHAIISLAGKTPSEWKMVRKTRVSVVHRHDVLPNASTGLYEQVVIVRDALKSAIFDLLGLHPESAANRIPIQEPSAVMVSVQLKNTPAEKILGAGPIPYLELRHIKETTPSTSVPAFSEPFAAGLSVALRNFDGECAPDLNAQLWTGKYYDLPLNALENRKTQFTARLLRDPVIKSS